MANMNRHFYHKGQKQARQAQQFRIRDLGEIMQPLREAMDPQEYKLWLRENFDRPGMSLREIQELVDAELAAMQQPECSCVLPEMSCPACRPEPWDGETELIF